MSILKIAALYFLAIPLLSLTTIFEKAVAKPFEQKCIGHLVDDPMFGYHLAKNEKGDPFDGVTWCDATIDEPLLKRVLQTCSPNDICRIEGLVEGHGTFSWVKINRLRKE